MATLLVINGPPGIGKTTIARELSAHRPPTLRLDVDEVRGLIVGWERAPEDSGRVARSMVADMASTFLAGGGDVVISQLYGRQPDLERLETVASETHATYVEVVLLSAIDDARERFVARGGSKLDDLRGPDDSLAGFDALYDRVVTVLTARPAAVEIRSRRGELQSTLALVRSAAGWE